MMDIYVGLLQWFIILFEKQTFGSGIKNENISNKKLAEELNKPIIRNFYQRKVQSLFIDNIWGEKLSGMQLISKCNKVFRFLLCIIYI